jgi:tyrosine-protein phosphatase SIW14
MRLATRGLLFVMLAAWCIPAAARPPAQPIQAGQPRSTAAAARAPAERLQSAGVPRLGRITSHFYRGGQPDLRGFAELKALGVDLVVNLRNEADEITRERSLVEARGMRYASIPWRGKEDPKPQQIADFLDLLRTNPGTTVFVHCERGAERTGVMVASYRIGVEHWTADQALDEMEVFGFRGLRFGHLKRFVRELPTLLTRDPLFKKPDAQMDAGALAGSAASAAIPNRR